MSGFNITSDRLPVAAPHSRITRRCRGSQIPRDNFPSLVQCWYHKVLCTCSRSPNLMQLKACVIFPFLGAEKATLAQLCYLFIYIPNQPNLKRLNVIHLRFVNFRLLFYQPSNSRTIIRWDMNHGEVQGRSWQSPSQWPFLRCIILPHP